MGKSKFDGRKSDEEKSKTFHWVGILIQLIYFNETIANRDSSYGSINWGNVSHICHHSFHKILIKLKLPR